MSVAVADAGVDEDAVVVGAGDAAFAEGTVFRTGRLVVAASGTGDGGMIVDMVVGVEVHVGVVIGGCDETRIGRPSEVEKYVREENGGDHGSLGGGSLGGED